MIFVLLTILIISRKVKIFKIWFHILIDGVRRRSEFSTAIKASMDIGRQRTWCGVDLRKETVSSQVVKLRRRAYTQLLLGRVSTNPLSPAEHGSGPFEGLSAYLQRW